MTGALVNTGAVIAGSLIGLAVGDRLSERIKTSVLNSLGLVTLWLGVTMVIDGTRFLVIVGSLIIGGVMGEIVGIEGGLTRFADWLKARTGSSSGKFVNGFVTASLLFCVGPMTVVGSIQDGTVGDATLIFTKSVMDGFAAMALSAATGIGVIFSAVTVLVVQGSLTLLGQSLAGLTEPESLNQLSAVGGLLMLGLGLRLLGIRDIPVANYLPALVIVAIVVVFF
ncbi:MAG: DUF554 domain-containing protein [Candidatus Zixiibacteriota bacterium]